MIPNIFARREPTLLELLKNTLERLETSRTNFRECWTDQGIVFFTIGVLCAFLQTGPAYNRSIITGYSSISCFAFCFFIHSYVNWCGHITDIREHFKFIQSISRNPRKRAGIEEVRRIIKEQSSRKNVNDIIYILLHLLSFIALTLTSIGIIRLRIALDLRFVDVPFLIIYFLFFIGFSLAALTMAIKNWRLFEEIKKMIPNIFARREPTRLELLTNDLERIETARTKFRECWTLQGLIFFTIGVLCSFYQTGPSYNKSIVLGYGWIICTFCHFFIQSYVNWCRHISDVRDCFDRIERLSQCTRTVVIEEVRQCIEDQRCRKNGNDIIYILFHIVYFIGLTLASIGLIYARIALDLPPGDVLVQIIFFPFCIVPALVALTMTIKNWRTFERAKKNLMETC
ncbi:hypothetical protein GCK72_008403 [Caenorhabditis remanei]|uniref:Uncharacterized protein n=1 Tax=Caenorhabditis remanei TaxID=31234 RepID=A0A6A5GYJ6_CAERE|nr:hypothetical protein GCK72_008403 [Caenorhabditis remanei]KAF1760157.1 hypothetical protein GCK72_008403 [Caenorhabditis remanei]